MYDTRAWRSLWVHSHWRFITQLWLPLGSRMGCAPISVIANESWRLVHGVFFVNVTAIKKLGCVNVNDTVHMVQFWLSQSHLCVQCHTWMGSIPILCDCGVWFIQKIWITVTSWEQFHKIALKNRNHIHIRSHRVNEPWIRNRIQTPGRQEMTRNKVRENCQPFGLCAWNTRQENDSHDAKQKPQISLISSPKHLFLVLAKISSR